MILVRILPPHAASSTILSVDRMDDKGLWQGHINHFFRLPKRKHPPCRRALGGSMSFWLPSNAPWSLDPGVRRENEGWASEGPGATVAPRPQNGPSAAGTPPARCPGSRPFVSPAKAGAQEPRWRRCHRPGLSALGTPPARCSPSRRSSAPSVPQSPWRLDVLLVAVQCSVVPGSRRSPGKRGVGKRGPRSQGGAAATERTQCSGHSAGTVFEYTPRSFPPRKQEPSIVGGQAATERSLIQWQL